MPSESPAFFDKNCTVNCRDSSSSILPFDGSIEKQGLRFIAIKSTLLFTYANDSLVGAKGESNRRVPHVANEYHPRGGNFHSRRWHVDSIGKIQDPSSADRCIDTPILFHSMFTRNSPIVGSKIAPMTGTIKSPASVTNFIS